MKTGCQKIEAGEECEDTEAHCPEQQKSCNTGHMELEMPGKVGMSCNGSPRQLPTPPQLTVVPLLSPANKQSHFQNSFAKQKMFASQSHSGNSVDSQLAPGSFSSLVTFCTHLQLVMYTAPCCRSPSKCLCHR